MLGNKLKKCDLFGRDVNFFYKGEEYYSTNWGVFVSFLVSTAIIVMVSLKMIEFFGVTDPIEYFSETPQNILKMVQRLILTGRIACLRSYMREISLKNRTIPQSIAILGETRLLITLTGNDSVL